jgi:hypothetical protein
MTILLIIAVVLISYYGLGVALIPVFDRASDFYRRWRLASPNWFADFLTVLIWPYVIYRIIAAGTQK